MRRRFNLIPFTVTIPPADRDPQLGDKLRAEWPGILAWAIDGCVAWQEQGLNPPQCVTEATGAYLETEDSFGTWIDECCDRQERAWEASKNLYASWRQWAEASGEFVGSQKRFAEAMQSHGFEPARFGTSRARGFNGISLK